MPLKSTLHEHKDEIKRRYSEGEKISSIAESFGSTYNIVYNVVHDQHAKYYEKNKESEKVRHRETHFRMKYGITLDEYNQMYEEQGGKCAICGEEETAIGANSDKVSLLSVDHDHETGEIRSLLCRGCNVGIGGFRENPEYLLKAIEYLEKFKK